MAEHRFDLNQNLSYSPLNPRRSARLRQTSSQPGTQCNGGQDNKAAHSKPNSTPANLIQTSLSPAPKRQRLQSCTLQDPDSILVDFAKEGGPDLADLRGVRPDHPWDLLSCLQKLTSAYSSLAWKTGSSRGTLLVLGKPSAHRLIMRVLLTFVCKATFFLPTSH